VRRGLELTLLAVRPRLTRQDLATVAMARTLADTIDDEHQGAASGQVIAALTRQLSAMVTELVTRTTPADDTDPALAALLDELSAPSLDAASA
jgi:hypothetical protein